MVYRSGTKSMMKGGLNPNRAKREGNSLPSGGGPAKNVQGSGSMGGTAHKNTMSHTDGCCAKAGGHLMGKGC